MTQDELLQLIDQAAAEGWTELDLSGQGLTELPPEIGKLTNLKQIYLYANQISEIPNSIADLKNLKLLGLSSNQIITIPDSLSQLQNLRLLALKSNYIAIVPDSLSHLKNLHSLDLSNNKIITIPDSLAKLANLQQLDLSSNKIITIPDSLSQLANLQQLYLRSNQITTIPDSLAKLANLQRLYLRNNHILAIPNSLETLSKLKKLDLRENLLPISPEILGPPELYEDPGSVEDIFGYLRQLRSGEVKPLNEAKMLLVGQGSVGKTSLINRLLDNRYNPNESQTDGINVREWGVHVNSKDVRLNVWDFGGQEIYHATHQFFLTKRSLYILVCNCRTSEEENRIEYWLKLIQSFGGESPVIIVGNKSDEQPLDINRKALREKYPNICAILETSCQTGQGIDELRATITKEVGKLREVYNLLPLSWFQAVRWYFQYFLRCPLVYLRILLALFVLGEAGSRDQGGINDHALQYRYPPSTEGGVDRLIDEVFYFVEDLLSLGSRPRYNSRAIRPGFSEAF